MVLEMSAGEERDVISSRKVGFSLDEDFFFLWRSPEFGQKKQTIQSE